MCSRPGSRAVRVGLLTGVALVGSKHIAFACICGTGGPPCQAAWKADAVFAARVRAIEPADVADPKEGAIR